MLEIEKFNNRLRTEENITIGQAMEIAKEDFGFRFQQVTIHPDVIPDAEAVDFIIIDSRDGYLTFIYFDALDEEGTSGMHTYTASALVIGKYHQLLESDLEVAREMVTRNDPEVINTRIAAISEKITEELGHYFFLSYIAGGYSGLRQAYDKAVETLGTQPNSVYAMDLKLRVDAFLATVPGRFKAEDHQETLDVTSSSKTDHDDELAERPAYMH